MPGSDFSPGEFCPYVGLQPFEASHADYFFGRRSDSADIADHLLARSITVVYGSSGVGKSSVVNVGLLRALEELQVAQTPRIFREWFPATRLMEWLSKLTANADSRLLLVFDQFEEFFLYRDGEEIEKFSKELRLLLRSSERDVHILFALRDDALHLLNAMSGYLPQIYDTRLELCHLDKDAVREAIEKPVRDVWNKRHEPPVAIDHDFAEALISQLSPRDKEGKPVKDGQIELAYLQLALERIWEAEGGAEARALRTSTLNERLKGVSEISRQHVEGVLGELPEADQALCATVFDRLVTPSGSKILYATSDLAVVAKVEPKRMDNVLASLANVRNRLLRAVPPPIGKHTGSYEILHDILARPILDWKQRYETAEKEKQARREAAEKEKRAQDARFSSLKTWAVIGTAFLALVAVGFAYWGFQQRTQAIAELQRYNEATGRGFWINLDLTTPNLTPSEVDALWQVVTANPVQRAAFIQQMLSDPAVLVRFGRRPENIMRTLGLVWPSPGEAQQILEAVLRTMKSSTDPAQLRFLAQAVNALPVRLTAEQAQAALDPVLKVITEATDANKLRTYDETKPSSKSAPTQSPLEARAMQERGLTSAVRNTRGFADLAQALRGLQALAGKLTPEQAQSALASVLKASAGTTNPNQLLVPAGKLTPEQAQSALASVLKAFTGTTNPNQLQALAQELSVPAGELTPERTQHALAQVLKAIAGTIDPNQLQALAQALQALAGKLTPEQAPDTLAQV